MPSASGAEEITMERLPIVQPDQITGPGEQNLQW
jgi:hypothetical protein